VRGEELVTYSDVINIGLYPLGRDWVGFIPAAKLLTFPKSLEGIFGFLLLKSIKTK
jgi:hypothetical protein